MLTDTFTAAVDTNLENWTSDSGTGWERVAGTTTQVVDASVGRLRSANATLLAIYRSLWVPPSANYYVLTRDIAASTATGLRSGVRVTATGDGYYGSWARSANTYQLITRVGGVETTTSVATTGNLPRWVRLEIEDTTLRLLATDGAIETLTEVLAITVDPVADGLDAVGSVGTHNSSGAATSTSRIHFDSLEADALPTPPAGGTNDELLTIRRRPMRGLVIRHS